MSQITLEQGFGHVYCGGRPVRRGIHGAVFPVDTDETVGGVILTFVSGTNLVFVDSFPVRQVTVKRAILQTNRIVPQTATVVLISSIYPHP